MGLKREKLDLSEERRILAALVTSTELLTRLGAVVQARAFESGFARTVAGWVVEYYQAIGQAPGRALVDIFAKKKSEIRDEDELDLVTEFLRNLSADWEQAEPTNVDYLCKAATEYFKIRALAHLKNQLENAIERGDFQLGEKLVGEFRRPETYSGRGVDILRDTDKIVGAYISETDALFRFSGALGHVIGPFERGDFVAFMGPPKRGKSWWLQHAAITALLSGLRVLVVNLEMLEPQVIRRIWSGLTGTAPKLPNDATMPQFYQEGDEKGHWRVDRVPIPADAYRETRTKATVQKEQALIRRAIRGGGLRLECRDTKSFSVRDLRAIMHNLEAYENFVSDVVVVDYADIMRSDSGEREERHRLNAIWTDLRGIAQEKRICLFTASQTGRAVMKGKDAKEFDVAEDMRKVAHVTKLITINATDAEKQAGLYRLACRITREGEQIFDQAVVTACLNIGRPHLASRLRRECAEELACDDEE